MRNVPVTRVSGAFSGRALARTVPRGQRGQVLLILVVMLSLASVMLVYGSTTAVARAVRADSITRSALEEARQALIGRAIADANRPGSLPCPDNDDDGSADLFTGSACSSYIGRLPWRTLGIGDLRDDAGERLWYVLSPGFRDHPLAPPLNTDTRGTLTVYSNSSARVVTTEGIAIVFAPGGAHSSQRRDAGLAPCATTGRDLPRSRCAANYLDNFGGAGNASPMGPFIAAAVGEAYNDRLAVIAAADLMPLVERRVALETRDALLAYRTAADCRCYPWADRGTDGASDAGASRGRIPAARALPQPWPAGTLPAYFAANQWSRVVHYAVARRALEDSGATCTTCIAPHLSLDGHGGYDVMLIATGYAERKRASGVWTDYIDDEANRDGDDHFVTPVSPKPGRDSLYAIAGSGSSCAANAQVLIDNLPCAAPRGSVRGTCQAASARLGECGCAAAARAILKPSCALAPGTPECVNALTELRRCTS